MKKNKLLYMLTILITLFTFNMNVKAAENLTCVYEKKDEEGANTKVVVQQDLSGTIKVYSNESNVAVTLPGWEKVDILRQDVKDNLVEKENNSDKLILKSCPNSITIRKETIMSGNCNHADPLNPCTTEERNIIEYYGEKTAGKQALISTENATVNQSSKDYNKKDPADHSGTGTSTNPSYEPNKVDTFTTGKSCSAAIEEYKTSADGKCDEGTCYASCYYGRYIENEGCHLVAISFDTNKDIKVKAIDPSYNANILYSGNSYDFSPIKQAIVNNDGWCLKRVSVYRSSSTQSYISEKKEDAKAYNNYYIRISEAGYNLLDKSKLQSENPDKNISFGELKLLHYSSCESLFEDESSKNLLKMVKTVITIIKIAIPILLTGLGITDFVKAVFSNKEDDMKKAQEKFIKRIIIAVCIFLVPSLLQLILKIANSIWGNISVDLCGIL